MAPNVVPTRAIRIVSSIASIMLSKYPQFGGNISLSKSSIFGRPEISSPKDESVKTALLHSNTTNIMAVK
ncbi:hypothetical protein D3C81_2212800 [compost metagenome]